MVNYSLEISETMSRMTLTIVFAEPFKVGNKLAADNAKLIVKSFLISERIPFSTIGKSKRVDECTFVMPAKK